LFDAGQYMNAARAFTGGMPGRAEDHYFAARAWAAAGYPDSAFMYLNRLPAQGWDAIADLESAAELAPLHADPRWTMLTAALRQKAGSSTGLNVLFAKRIIRARDI